jgi:ankyrin repeat protein
MRIFLSYSRADLKIAEQIAANLKQAGHDIFFDRHSIKVAEDFNRVIWNRIQKAQLFVYLISPNSVRVGSYTLTELELAEKKWPSPEHRLLSVIIAPTDLGQIPVYVTLVDMLQPEGNVAAEVRTAVNALNKRYRTANLWRSTAIMVALVLAGMLAVQGYRAYLDHGPVAARTRLAQMNVPFTDDAFVASAKDGDLSAVKLFLAAGMDPNALDDNRHTALIQAIKFHRFDVVSTLLEDENIKINAAVVAAAGLGQQGTVRALLEIGVTAKASNGAFVASAAAGQLDILRMLLAGNIEQISIDEAFVAAVKGNQPEIARFLKDKISNPPDIASRALLEIVDSGARVNTDSVKFLLDLGADINTRAEDGDTLLVRSLRQRGQPELLRMLLAHGADVNRKGSEGQTALMVAVVRDVELVEILLEQGARVNDSADGGETALHFAAAYGSTDTIKVLLDAGADVNAICACQGQPYTGGGTALFEAVHYAHYRAVEVLIANGADVNRKNSAGQSTLIIAAERGFTDIARALLKAGARAADTDKDGHSAETLARRGKHSEIVELLQAAAPVPPSP